MILHPIRTVVVHHGTVVLVVHVLLVMIMGDFYHFLLLLLFFAVLRTVMAVCCGRCCCDLYQSGYDDDPTTRLELYHHLDHHSCSVVQQLSCGCGCPVQFWFDNGHIGVVGRMMTANNTVDYDTNDDMMRVERRRTMMMKLL